MTYDEAKFLLSTLERNPYPYLGELHTALIVPEIENEKISFVADIRDGLTTKDEVSKYSSNNKYTINGYMNKSFNL